MRIKFKSAHLYQRINKEFKIFAGISFGIFLFLLFFQPFTLNRFDFNNQMLFFLGMGVIVFLFMALVRVGLPWWIQRSSGKNDDTVLPANLKKFLIFGLSAVALSFYLRYVGLVDITFYVIFKLVFICIIPPVILRVYDMIEARERTNEAYLEENKRLQNLVNQFREINRNETITFVSENSSEKFNFPVSDVVKIRSADNYVEILYKEGEQFKKQLLRNTLKHIEHQTIQYASFIRCHRTCIINIHHAENLKRRQNSYWLSIKNYTEQVPVSRQYLMRIKEAIPANKG